MNPNPYSPPLEQFEPVKVQSRLWTYLDIAAIICAAMPLVLLGGIFVAVELLQDDEPSDTFIIVFAVSIMMSGLLWLAGGIYNTASIFYGRQLARIGLFVNILAVACWIGLLIVAYSY